MGIRHPKYLFRVEIDGIESARFQKVEGLDFEIEYDDYDEGGSLETEHDAGKATYSDIVLTRGLTDNIEMWNWFKLTLDIINNQGGNPADYKKNLDIVRLGRDMLPITGARYRIIEAGPSKYAIDELDASVKSGYSIESVTLKIKKWYKV